MFSLGIDRVEGDAHVESKFEAQAVEVLQSLCRAVSGVLSTLGTFSRPADVQHALALDKTLCRQIFKLACAIEPLGSGGVVPSRTAIGRFLDVARERGVPTERLANVWTAFEVFEKLIKTHAGDRATFNSMVSAASGVDEDWIVADAQHRRNAYRAMSHALGVQIKTRFHLFIVNQAPGADHYEAAVVSGLIRLRVLRALPSVRVDGVALGAMRDAENVSCEALGIGGPENGYLLEEFSSKPLPALKISHGSDESDLWREVAIQDPEVGNIGTSTLMFGSVYRGLPVAPDPLRLLATTGKPAELLLFDVLINPAVPGKPAGSALLGQNEKFGGEIIPLAGRFETELRGQGVNALATPEVPHYPEMLRTLGERLGWDLAAFNAWRMRVEFPLYQSTAVMTWPLR